MIENCRQDAGSTLNARVRRLWDFLQSRSSGAPPGRAIYLAGFRGLRLLRSLAARLISGIPPG